MTYFLWQDITALTADSYLVFAAAGPDIYVWRRGNELQRVFRGGGEDNVHTLLPFGPHLVSVDRRSLVRVWDIKSGDVYLEMTFDNDKFCVSALCHPSTYINKILLASSQGRLQLWNINTCKENGASHDSPDRNSTAQVNHICGGCHFLGLSEDLIHPMKTCKNKSKDGSFH